MNALRLLLMAGLPLVVHAEPRREPVAVDASFDLAMPAGWTVDRRANGVLLTKASSAGVPARIVVRYVPPASEPYADGAAYMSRLTRPSSVPLKGWKNGAIEDVAAAGRKALRLLRDTTDMSEPGSMAPREVPMKEEHLAVPAAKGFYLLVYTAPRADDAALRLAFRRVAASFKPKL